MNIKYPKTDWTNWTIKKNSIKSYVELPEPKVNINYGYDEDEF